MGYTRIVWSNGAAWSKDESAKDMVFEQPNLLSDHQVDVIVDRVNGAIDIWLLSEDFERSLIEPPVKQTNEQLRECMESFTSVPWVNALKILLDESKSPDSKAAEVQEILNAEIREPLVAAL